MDWAEIVLVFLFVIRLEISFARFDYAVDIHPIVFREPIIVNISRRVAGDSIRVDFEWNVHGGFCEL